MRKYILVMATEFAMFTAQVNESVESGYEPLGAPILKGDTIIQALVLKSKEDTAKEAKPKKTSV